ncbi:hypothetical protein IEO21_04292 [Rhodonia placenta]|uniref:Uncharacterized protein n=1 Tax=Rhodonia placenta TaxID=104341 RepID=A0A8H7P4E9_9APHY|nr:hypothetical protein IEO21_04292 [Postia placenta]
MEENREHCIHLGPRQLRQDVPTPSTSSGNYCRSQDREHDGSRSRRQEQQGVHHKADDVPHAQGQPSRHDDEHIADSFQEARRRVSLDVPWRFVIECICELLGQLQPSAATSREPLNGASYMARSLRACLMGSPNRLHSCSLYSCLDSVDNCTSHVRIDSIPPPHK